MRLFTLCLLLLVSAFSSSARIITATSGSRDHVQAAVSSARLGDTVQIPAGNFVFNGGVSVKSGITIMGAGRDKTTLRRTTSGGTWLFTVDCSAGGRFVMSGMTIIGMAPSLSPGVKLVNHCKDFRIYDNTFRRCNDRAIEVHGNAKGVVDHNTFIDNTPTAVVIFGDGDAGWTRPLRLGTDDAVYVEDNFFEQRNVSDPGMVHHIASNNGSRYVFRHNKIVDGTISSQAVDAHGNKFYWPRGSRGYEVYNNVFEFGHRWAGMNIRGGDGVIFNNEFKGSVVSPIHLMHEGRSGDGNCTYPCVDQIRRLHIWNNTYNGKSFSVYNRHPSIVRVDRDYFLTESSAYVPYSYPHPLTAAAALPTTSAANQNNTQSPVGMSLRSMADQGEIVRISYSIPDGILSSDPVVMFNFYSVQGRLVRSISREHRRGGTYQFQWDGLGDGGQRLAKGVYRVDMVTTGARMSNSLILMR